MGLFKLFFARSEERGGATPPSGPYVTQGEFEENLSKQGELAPKTVAQLRAFGVTQESELKLEFFFYSNSDGKAASLVEALTDLGYHSESSTSAGDPNLVCITGWTTPMKMEEEAIVAWTEQMVRLGFKHDCEFDGWGTNPIQ